MATLSDEEMEAEMDAVDAELNAGERTERIFRFQVENDQDRATFDIDFVIYHDDRWAKDSLGVVVGGASTGPLAEIKNAAGFIKHLVRLGAERVTT